MIISTPSPPSNSPYLSQHVPSQLSIVSLPSITHQMQLEWSYVYGYGTIPWSMGNLPVTTSRKE